MNNQKYLAMFPGQGSQAIGMGQKFFDGNEIAKKRFAEADEALASFMETPLSKLCFDGPLEELSKTQYAQPAILTVSAIAYEIFVSQTGFQPTVAAGHSLGEYSALVAAGVLSFADAVVLVHKRGLYMQESVAPGKGAMVAILGKEPAEIEAAMKSVTSGLVQFANINAPGQIVIAGEKEAVDAAVQNLGKVKAIPLPVSVPSHTALMKPAAEKLALDFEKLTFSDPKFPVYSNVTGEISKDSVGIRKALLDQLTSPVQWVSCVTNAIQQNQLGEIIEFGHGQVLCGLAKRIAPEIKKSAIDSPDAVTNYTVAT